MKQAGKLLSVITIFLFLAFSSPAIAQVEGTATTTNMEDDNEGFDDWGLLGLLGLIGLYGLKRHDDRHRTTTRRDT